MSALASLKGAAAVCGAQSVVASRGNEPQRQRRANAALARAAYSVVVFANIHRHPAPLVAVQLVTSSSRLCADTAHYTTLIQCKHTGRWPLVTGVSFRFVGILLDRRKEEEFHKLHLLDSLLLAISVSRRTPFIYLSSSLPIQLISAPHR